MDQNQNSNLDKLSMLDDHGHKIHLYAAEVTGYFRKHRNWTQFILIAIFLLLPWTKMNGVQTLLLDIPNRKFAIFGLTFFAHDGPLLFFIFAISTLGLAFSTAVWGRIWCGWACPQTVFIDGVFRKIEILTEGTHLKRRALDQGPVNLNYIFRKLAKWILFTLVSSVIAHSFIAYFTGSEELIKMIQSNPKENWWPFVFVTFTTAVILFDFGWFREQFCIIMCPYGRFQSVLQDRQSVTVMYDENRGEPRKGSAQYGEKKGDCISCSRCVQVCPTGIDIRNGIQMECIACTACIDACDEIMEKIKKPKGLIKYSSLDGTGTQLFRPRTILYLSLIALAAIGLTYNIANRKPLEIFILRAKDSPYTFTKSADGQDLVINHMRLHITNQTFNPKEIEIKEPSDWIQKGIHLTSQETKFHMSSGEFKTVHLFVTLPKEVTKGLGQYKTQLLIESGTDQFSKDFTLVGPAQ